VGVFGIHILEEREVVRGQQWYRSMVVSYRLSTVTLALSVNIRPQFAIECIRRSNQTGGGSHWAKFREERVDRYKSYFSMVWERHGAVV